VQPKRGRYQRVAETGGADREGGGKAPITSMATSIGID
jgi:hypothetical protein